MLWANRNQCCTVRVRVLTRRAAAKAFEVRELQLGSRAAAGAHALGELAEDRDGRLPADAGVGDALAVAQGGGGAQGPPALPDEALNHDAEDRGLALRELRRDVLRDERLAAVGLVAVALARVGPEARPAAPP